MANRGTKGSQKVKFHENQQFILEDASALQDLIVNGYLEDVARATFGNYYGLLTGLFGFSQTAEDIENGRFQFLPSKDLIFRPRTTRWDEVAVESEQGYADHDGIFGFGWQDGDPLVITNCDAYLTELEQVMEQSRVDYNNTNGTNLTMPSFLSLLAAEPFLAYTTYLVGKIVVQDSSIASRQVFDDISRAASAQNLATRTQYRVELELRLRPGRISTLTDSTNYAEGEFLIGYSRSYIVRQLPTSGVDRIGINSMTATSFNRTMMERSRISNLATSGDSQQTWGGLIRGLCDIMHKMNNDGVDDPTTMTTADRSRSAFEGQLPQNSLAGLRKRIDSLSSAGEVAVHLEETDVDTTENNIGQQSFTGQPGLIARCGVKFADASQMGLEGQDFNVNTNEIALYAPRRRYTDDDGNEQFASGITYPINAGRPYDEGFTFGFGVPLVKQSTISGAEEGDPDVPLVDDDGNPVTYVDRFNYIFTPQHNAAGYFYLLLRPGFTDDYTVHDVRLKVIMEGTSYPFKETQIEDMERFFSIQHGNTSSINQRFVRTVSMLEYGHHLNDGVYNSTGVFTSPVSGYKGIFGLSNSISRFSLGTGNANSFWDPNYVDTDYTSQLWAGGFRQGIRINTPLITPGLRTAQIDAAFAYNTTEYKTMLDDMRDQNDTQVFSTSTGLFNDGSSASGVAPFPFMLIVEVYGEEK